MAKFMKTGITTARPHARTDIPTNFLQKNTPPDTFTILYPIITPHTLYKPPPKNNSNAHTPIDRYAQDDITN